MTLPIADEYQSAVQNPALVFFDSRLKTARPRLGRWDLPAASVGSFAAVFRLDRGSQSWAVRCFTQLPSRASERYQAMSAYLGSSDLPWFVRVEYLDPGIKVRSGSWPVSVMPWVPGMALNDWVSNRVYDAASLRALRDQLRAMMSDLEAAGVAHGDLQHGNVVIGADGALRLLDYDGMYLPAFSGWDMPELGHPNYQHPLRAEATYGPGLDRFSAIVIWTALASLEEDPELWGRFDDGDNMLFRSADLSSPESSELFGALAAKPGTRILAESLIHITQSDPDRVPALETVVGGGVVPITAPVPKRVGPVAPYPVVDLRHPSIAPQKGSRITAVGEVLDRKRGTTRYGDPYQFIRFGSRTGSILKIVIWSEVLAKVQGRLPDVGDVVTVTGVITSFAGQRQIELERAANLETVGGPRIRELLGSAWSEDPPPERKIEDLRVGDVVEHAVFGQGLVTESTDGVATIRFSHSERRIHTASFPLRLISRARQASASVPPGPALDGASKPPQRIDAISRRSAATLGRLFGDGYAGADSAATQGQGGPPRSQAPPAARSRTPHSSFGLPEPPLGRARRPSTGDAPTVSQVPTSGTSQGVSAPSTRETPWGASSWTKAHLSIAMAAGLIALGVAVVILTGGIR